MKIKSELQNTTNQTVSAGNMTRRDILLGVKTLKHNNLISCTLSSFLNYTN